MRFIYNGVVLHPEMKIFDKLANFGEILVVEEGFIGG